MASKLVVRGCDAIDFNHVVAAHWKAVKIRNRGLQIGHTVYGTAAWAYYIDMVPRQREKDPFVVFDVDDKFVEKFPCPLPKNPNYAFMKMPRSFGSHIPIKILGFYNIPILGAYNGHIGYF